MFNDTLNHCDLTDLGYHGNIFTWANNQPDNTHIKERLDRFCANSNWTNFFPRYINKHLVRHTSDHSPILLEFQETMTNFTSSKRNTIQRFEHIWAQDQESNQIIQTAWNNSYGSSPNKLKYALDQVSKWGRSKYGAIPRKIKELHTKLEGLKNQIPNQNCIFNIKATE